VKPKKYSEHALEVLRLVQAGRPWEGRSAAGRRKHLHWLEDEGLIVEDSGTWRVTDKGLELLIKGSDKS